MRKYAGREMATALFQLLQYVLVLSPTMHTSETESVIWDPHEIHGG
jgi:hypothetical protein